MATTKNTIRVGLDIAHKMGVAYVNSGTKKIFTTIYTGTPQEQLENLQDVLGDVDGITVAIEQLVSFRNANTVRSLMGRIGYIAHSLKKGGVEVVYFTPSEVRKSLGCKTKQDVLKYFRLYNPKLTDDEADAIAVATYEMGVNFDEWTIERLL